MRPCRRFIAELGMTGSDRRMMELIGRRNAPERGNCVAIAARNEISPAEVVPKPLGVVGVEAHGLLDPSDPFLRLSEPRQDLALLHHNEVVVGVETDCPLLMVGGLVVIFPGQVHGSENPMDVAVVAVEL